MIAFKTWSQVINPLGIPGDWPSNVITLGEGQLAPEGYTVLSIEEFTQYIAQKESLYNEWLQSQGGNFEKMVDLIFPKIGEAMEFGRSLIQRFAARNIARGITKAEVKTMIQNMHILTLMLLTGSLHTALEELEEMEPSDLVPRSEIDYFIDEIKGYLGV